MTPRRFRSLVLGACLVAAACGGSSGTDLSDGSVGDGLGSTVAPADPGAGGTPSRGPAPGSPPGGSGGGTAPDPSGDGGPTAPGPSPGTRQPGSPRTTSGSSTPAYGSGPVGSFAPILLRPEPAGEIVVEVLTQAGAEPRQATIDHVRSLLARVSGKPVRLSGGSVPGEGRSWSGDEIRAAADAASSVTQGDGRAVIRLLFLLGRFDSQNGQVIGVAVRGDVAAVFSEDVEGAETPLVSDGAIEAAVTAHEVGHLLGLVDLFLDTGRADPDHPGHSRNEGSVMYWAVESESVADILTGGPSRDLDDADRADLEQIRQG